MPKKLCQKKGIPEIKVFPKNKVLQKKYCKKMGEKNIYQSFFAKLGPF
jgi:hypothetical protein